MYVLLCANMYVCVNKYVRYMYMCACAIVCVRGHVLYACTRMCVLCYVRACARRLQCLRISSDVCVCGRYVCLQRYAYLCVCLYTDVWVRMCIFVTA
jgi:hypothetical protein